MIIQHIKTRGGWGINAPAIPFTPWPRMHLSLPPPREQFHREAEIPLVEPVQPPDFSTLDDGSKRDESRGVR
jgi:hypothetical protein